MGPNTILGIMIASYIAPIAYVYYKYRANATNASGTRSISSIITSQEPLFLRENDTGGGGPHTTAIIPNQALHRRVYVYHGFFHDIIRNPAMCHTTHKLVPIHHRRPPHRDIRCYFNPRTRPNPLHIRRYRIFRDSLVYDRAYTTRRLRPKRWRQRRPR